MTKQDDGEATTIASSVREVLEEMQIDTETEKISNSSNKKEGDIGTDTGTIGEEVAAVVSIQEETGVDVAVEGTEAITTEEEKQLQQQNVTNSTNTDTNNNNNQHAATAAEMYIAPVWSVVYASNPGLKAILQEGDHIIRWEMLPIIYPIQIHAIVIEVTEVYVKLVDFGRTAVPDHDEPTPATEQEQEQKVDMLHKYLVNPLSFAHKNNTTTTTTSDSKTSSSGSTNKTKKDRLNIKILTTVEELKPWSKVNYGGGLFGGTSSSSKRESSASSSEEKDGGKKITATTTKKKWLGGYFGTTTKKRSSSILASSSNDHHDDDNDVDDDGNNEQQQQQEITSSASFTPMETVTTTDNDNDNNNDNDDNNDGAVSNGQSSFSSSKSNLKIGQGRLIKAGWNRMFHSSNNNNNNNVDNNDNGNSNSNDNKDEDEEETNHDASYQPLARTSTVSSRASSSFGCIEKEEEKEDGTAMQNDNDNNGNINNDDDNDSTTSSNDCVIDGTDNIAPGDGVEESKEAEITVDADDHNIDHQHHHDNGTDSEERTVSTKSQEDYIKEMVEHKQKDDGHGTNNQKGWLRKVSMRRNTSTTVSNDGGSGNREISGDDGVEGGKGKGKGGLLGFGLIPSISSGQSNVNSSNNINNKGGDHKKRASSMASMKSFFTLKNNETHDGDTTHDNHNDEETKGTNLDGKRTSSKFMNPAMVKLMQSSSGDDDGKNKKKRHSSVLSKDAKEQLSKLPKDDPTKLVLARVCFLLAQGETVLPPYNVFHSNSETIAVWCKTGSFKTIQADVFLHSTAIGNGKSAMAIGIGVAAASGVAAAGVAGIGVAAVVAPWWYLKHSKDKCYDATTSLNDTFWSQAEPEVFVDCIQKWSRSNKNNSDAVDKKDEEEDDDDDDDDVSSAMTATTNATTTAASTATTEIES